jgi:hypothetical protein
VRPRRDEARRRTVSAPPDPHAPRGSALWEAGVLERFATEADLTPDSAFDISWAYEYLDEQALVRGMLSTGGMAGLVGSPQENDARTAIVEALAPCRTPTGGYRLENEWHYLIASSA